MDNTFTSEASPEVKQPAKDWLTISAKTWFIVTAIGQWLFVIYIAGFFGLRFLANGLTGFEDTHLANGFIPGDGMGNVALALHILVAGLIIAAGQLQLLPNIRQHLPRLHRYSGRFYMIASIVVSAAGIYLMWSRERVIGSVWQDVGTTFGGLLTFALVPIALYYAIKRDIPTHRRWALRLFMVVSAVWYLRLMIFGWILATGGAGMDMDSFSGPFLVVVHFAQYLLPLAFLELYFLAQKQQSRAYKNLVAGSIFAASLIMTVGVIANAALFWVPSIGS